VRFDFWAGKWDDFEMNELNEIQFKKFVDDFSKTVAVPDSKGTQFLLCPVGLVGSGKTTVIKPLAEKLGLVRISTDEIRKSLKEQGFSYQKTEDIAFEVGYLFIDKKYGVAIDADCVRPDKKEQIETLAKKKKIPVVWIHINPPEEFILNKLRSYPHTWLFKNADDAIKNYEARKPLHEKLNFDFTYTFDTSRPDLNEQIGEATKIILKKLGN